MIRPLRLAPALLLIWLGLSCLPLQAGGSPVPRKAPAFAIQTAPEKYIWLSEYAGRPIILAFILTDCSHCQYTTGLLSAIQRDYADRGLQVIESAIDSMSALRIPDFLKKLNPPFPVGYNEQSYAAIFLGYGEKDPMFAPQIVFIDRTGMIRAQFGGDDPKLLKEVQDKMLRETLDQTLKAGGQDPPTKKGPVTPRPPAPTH
jgi:peroxiredoxin